MHFYYIELKNFKNYGDYTTKLELGNNDTRLLIGENGSGKTSFVDAIIWAIYGRSECSIDDIVNRQTKKDCKVEINFNIGNENFSIIRYRNHTEQGNKILLFKNKENISRRTSNDTQDLINEIIQVQYNAMISSILFSSELYISFLRSKMADRIKIIESILSLKEIQEYYEVIREMRKPISDKMTELYLNKEKIISEIGALEKSVFEYKENIKKKLIDLKNQRDEIQKKIEEIKTDIEVASHIDFEKEISLNKIFSESTEQNKKIFLEVEEEKKHLIDTSNIINELEKCKKELEEINHIDVDEELLRIRESKEIEKFNLDIDNEILKLKNELFDIREKEKIINFHTNEIEKIQNEVNEIKENLERCITCGQKVSSEFSESLIDKKEKQILSLKEESDKLKRDIKSIKGNNERIKEEMEILKRKKRIPPSPTKFTENYLLEIGKTKEYLLNQIKLYENSFCEKEKFNSNINFRIKSLSEKLVRDLPKKSKYDNKYLEWLKNNSAEQQTKIIEYEKEISLINERAKSVYDKKFINDLEKRIKNNIKELNKISREMEKVKEEDFHYEILQQLFSNKSIGIKKYIIDKMLTLFNEKVNFYLPIFFNEEISITFDKDLSETITVDKNLVPFATFSSGEKTRFELAIAFSLFMLVKTFFSTTINLLIFDEILDQNLDKKGIQAVLEIINSLGAENSILVISHREELKEYFNNQLSVIRGSEGFSELVER